MCIKLIESTEVHFYLDTVEVLCDPKEACEVSNQARSLLEICEGL